MKKIFLVLFMALILAAAGICAADDQGSEWNYEVLENGTAMITAYRGTNSDVLIPDQLDGYPVSALVSDVFRFNEEITSVEIPENLTTIGDYVFLMDSQKWLTSYRSNGKPYILVPEVAKILVDYFAVYAGTVQVNPFLGCYNLENIAVSPDNPAFAIADNMLISKTTNEAISYPAGRQETEYTVPEGITSIGFQTFFGSNLTSVTLPDSLAEIGQNPFVFCTNLKEISVSDGNDRFSIRDSALVSENGTLISYPQGSEAGAYTVPEGIKAIGDGAFFNAMALQEVILPEGVISIGARAFDHCESLISAELPDGLISIGDEAFMNCDNLKEINLPGTVTSIDEMAFYNVGRQLVFTVEKNTYGELWAAAQKYRYHFPGEPEKKSSLTEAFEQLKDENGEVSKFHLNYRAERASTGQWFTRDAYSANGNVYIIDENESDGVKITLYRDKKLYTLHPDSKTGESLEDEHWYFEMDGVINETKKLFTLIRSHVNRKDYTSVSRVLQNEVYHAEVFPEYRYGPEIAFYFDRDGRLVYCYEEIFHGTSPAGYGTGELLFTIYEFSNDFDESVFDISDYEITELERQEPVHISDAKQLMDSFDTK